MDLTSKNNIRRILKEYNISPSKRLGQNFLISGTAFSKIIQAAEISPKDTILEIGPGIGNLTQKLAERAGRVIAIEKDRKIVEILKETLRGFNNVEIIPADILKIENCKLIENWLLKIENYKLVANLPYYITSPVIRKFLEIEKPPELMVLMVQKEVAQRICPTLPRLRGTNAKPRMNLLAISVQFYTKAEIISYVSKKCFWPSPKVDSAIIKITPFNSNKVFACAFSHKASEQRAQDFRILFFKVVKAGFSHPRKQLVNNLLALMLPNNVKLDKEKIKELLLKNNIIPTQRAERLDIKNWIELADSLKDVL